MRTNQESINLIENNKYKSSLSYNNNEITKDQLNRLNEQGNNRIKELKVEIRRGIK